MKKNFKGIIILLIGVLLLMGCSKKEAATSTETTVAPASTATTAAPAASGGDTIKIGVICPLTGTLAFGGNEVKNAVEMAAASRPELLGKKVEVISADAADATQAMSEFERLYSQGVRYFMGSYGSFTDLAIKEVVDEKGCIYIAAAGWSDALTETKIKNFFHFTPTVSVFGTRMAEYMPEYADKYLGIKKEDLKVAVVWNTNVEYVAQAALKGLQAAGINVVVQEGYPADRKDFSALISKLQSSDIDVLIPCQQSTDGIPFRKKMVEMGYEPKMLFAMGLVYDQPDFAALGADIVDGAFCLSYTHPQINRSVAPGLDEFAETYNKKFGWYPMTHATQTYSGTLFLMDMIEKAGTTDIATVQKTIESADIQKGVYPNYWGVKFDENHRNTRAGDPLVIGQYQNSKLVAVGTDEIKVGDAIVPWDPSKLTK